MNTMRMWKEAITEELEERNISGWRIEMGGKHPHLIVPGVPGKFVFPKSSSDKRRALLNSISSLRRFLSGQNRFVRSN